ncbi:MAG: TylF/MycF/NovP-related O-methyltransferase [Candidatus Thiodiazotropha taylori]
MSEKLSTAQLLYGQGRYREALQVVSSLKAVSPALRGIDLLRAKCILALDYEYADSSAEQALLEEQARSPYCKDTELLLCEIRNRQNIYGRDIGFVDDEEFLEVLPRIREHTMLANIRLYTLWRNTKKLLRCATAGNILEYGTARGGSAVLLAWLMKTNRIKGKVYAFDSFNGMPPPNKHDTSFGKSAGDLGWGEGTCYSDLSCLLQLAAELDVQDFIYPVKGYFEDTLGKISIARRSVLASHVDCDWYDSVSYSLNHAIPLLADEHYLQIDDYGYWDGVELAVKNVFEIHRYTAKAVEIDGYSMGFLRG